MYGIKLRVFGRVQGVFFRASCQSEAKNCGLRGSVRNLPDGSVEILAFGKEDALLKLAAWSRIGSDLSSVAKVELSDWDAFKCPENFIISL